MTIRVDDSEAENYECPPEGLYEVEVTTAEERISRKGVPMIALCLKVTGSVHDGWTVFDNLMMAGRGAGIGIQKAKAFGFDLKCGDEVDAEDFIGRRVQAWCKQERYQGRTNLKVDISAGTFCGYDTPGTRPTARISEEGAADNQENIDVPF